MLFLFNHIADAFILEFKKLHLQMINLLLSLSFSVLGFVE